MTSRISSFESGRLLALVAIVTIHSQAFMTFPEINGQPWIGMLLNQLSRFAVPLFFLLAGYLIQPKLTQSPWVTWRSYALPLFKIWLIWSVLYLLIPFNLHTLIHQGYWVERTQYWGYLATTPLNSLFEGGLVHLWYVPALIIGTSILSAFATQQKSRYLLILAVALYAYGLMAGSYQPIFDASAPIFTRNGPFVSTLMLTLGFLIRQKNWHISRSSSALLMIFGLLGHLFEAQYLTTYGTQFFVHDFLISTPLWALGLFFLLISHPTWGEATQASKYSPYVLGIYLCHLLVIIYLSNIAKLLDMPDLLKHIMIIPLTLLISFAIVKGIERSRLKSLLLR